MYFVFLLECLKRAFSPTARVTDVLQILAASTLPAITKFAGIRLPANAGNDALAYIGLIAVSFIVIRLLWAPYSIWTEQTGEIGRLKTELTKPERLVMEHLAKHRAEAITKAQAKLLDAHLLTFGEQNEEELVHVIFDIERLVHQAGLKDRHFNVINKFLDCCTKGRSTEAAKGTLNEYEFLDDCLAMLAGEPIVESLERRLQQGTEPEKQP